MEQKTAQVLIVDDEPASRESYQEILVKAGFAATTTTREALRNVDLNGYDVLLIDLERTGICGLTLLDEVKDRQPRIEVIGIAAKQSLEEAKEAVRYGASDFVAKPLTPACVTTAVTQALERTEWTIRLTHTPSEAGATCSLSPCWLEYEGDQEVVVGIERVFMRTLDTPIYVELPEEGQRIRRNDALLKILTRDGQIHVLTSPVAGSVLRSNEALLWDMDEIRQAGWAVRLNLERSECHANPGK